jgi:hypothetical protein
MIKWKPIVDTLLLLDGEHVSLKHTYNIPVGNPHFVEIMKQLESAKYDFSSVDWIDYYPRVHFDNTCVDEFSKLVDHEICRAWISRVDPGKNAPWHWDVDNQETEFLKLGKLKRWTCFITEPKVGHSLIIGNKGFYNEPAGTIYEWPNYREWHCAANCGLEPQFLFHCLGYQ